MAECIDNNIMDECIEDERITKQIKIIGLCAKMLSDNAKMFELQNKTAVICDMQHIIRTLFGNATNLNEFLAEFYAKKFADEPDEEPTEEPGDESDEEPDNKPAEEPDEEPGDESDEEPDNKPAEEPDNKPAEEPTEESYEEPTEESYEEPTEEPGKESGNKPTKEPDDESTKKPAEEPENEPKDEEKKQEYRFVIRKIQNLNNFEKKTGDTLQNYRSWFWEIGVNFKWDMTKETIYFGSNYPKKLNFAITEIAELYPEILIKPVFKEVKSTEK